MAGYSKRYLWAGLVFLATLALFAATLPPSILPGDSGELIAASHTLSIAHPPGYSLYLMLGKVFASAIAWGSIAYRYNLMSAMVASLTAAVFCLLLIELGIRRLIGLAITLAVFTHQAFWLQAAATEVYTLNAFFTVMLLYFGIAFRRYGERSFLVLAYVGGLALTHHLTMVYALIGAALCPLILFRRVPRPKTLFACAFLGLLGLTAWLYIPIRAGLDPPLTWGRTDTMGGFISHITASRYAWRLKTFDVVSRIGDFLRFFRLIASEFGLPLIGLAALGLALAARSLRLVAAALAVIVLFAVHFAAYNIPDIQGHILPALIAIGVLAAVGVERAADYTATRSPLLSKAIAIAVFVIAAANVATLYPRQDEWLAHDYARAIVASARDACGPSPVIITSTDLAGLSLAYLAYVEEEDAVFYMQGISHHSIIGSTAPTRSIDEAIEIASRNFGPSRLCVLGGVESEALPTDTPICGMVSVPYPGEGGCRSPYDYEVRGIGEDPRDFFSRALSAEYYLHLARWYNRRQEREEAVELVKKATGLARGDAQTYVDASRLYLAMDRLQDAEDLLKQAVDAEPTHFFAHFALANVYQMDGRTTAAVEEYERALRGNPQPAPAHVNLGNIHLTEGRYEKAIEHFGEALELEASNQAALLGMAGALEASGRAEEALGYLDRAALVDAGDASAVHAKSSLLMKAGRYPEVNETLRAGLEASPDDPILLADLGLYFLRTGKPDSAAAYLERALDTSPELLTARGNLAVAYERQGLIEKAIEQYRAYVEQAPPGPSREMAERAIRELTGQTTD